MIRTFYTYLIILESGVVVEESTGRCYVYIKAGRAENAEKRYLNHLRGHSGDRSNVGIRVLTVEHRVEDFGDENYFRAMMNFIEEEVAFRDSNSQHRYACPVGGGKQEFMIASPQVLEIIIQACIQYSFDLMKEGVTISSKVVYQEPIDKINNFINNVIYSQKALVENTDDTMAFIDDDAEIKYWSTYLDTFKEQLDDIYYLRAINSRSTLEEIDDKPQKTSLTHKIPQGKVKKKSYLPYVRFTENKIEVVKPTIKQKRSGKTKQTVTVIASRKAPRITFDFLQIPPGSEVTFIDGKKNVVRIDCITTADNKVYAKGEDPLTAVTMSKFLGMHPSSDRGPHSQTNSWYGPGAFYYNGRCLPDIAVEDFGWTGKR